MSKTGQHTDMTSLSANEEYLLLGRITGSLSASEAAACEELLHSNTAAAAAYAALLQQLPAEDTANHFRRLQAPDYWENLPARFTAPPTGRSLYRRLFRPLAAAAVLLLLGAGAWLLWQQQNATTTTKGAAAGTYIELVTAGGQVVNLSQQQGTIQSNGAQLRNNNNSLQYTATTSKPSGTNRITIPAGMDYHITLQDGTQVWLNSGTQLEFPFAFTGNTREISIHGEAYLEVATRPNQPFTVHLPHSTVQVLGTAFNVNSYNSSLEKVALVSGAVQLQTTATQLRLLPGTQAIYQVGGNVTQESFEARRVLGWRKGLFYFEDAGLQEIGEVVSRWFGVSVQIDNNNLQHKHFAGVLNKKQPLERFREDLKAISGIDSYIDRNGVLHFK